MNKNNCICTECEYKNKTLFCTFWTKKKENGFVVKCDAFKTKSNFKEICNGENA